MSIDGEIPLVDVRIEAFDPLSINVESSRTAVLVLKNDELEVVFKAVQNEIVGRFLIELETQYFLKTFAESLWYLGEHITVYRFAQAQLQ